MGDVDDDLEVLDDEVVGDGDRTCQKLRGAVFSAKIALGVGADLDVGDDEVIFPLAGKAVSPWR